MIRLNVGIYICYLPEWMEVFGRGQVKVVTLEQFHTSPMETLQSLFSFLGVSTDLDWEKHRVTLNKAVKNKGPYKETMNNETRKALDVFYKPYNEMLADYLGGDSQFLFDS